jgi:hypothetical protein
MMTFYVISGLVAFLALILFAMYCCYRAGQEDEREKLRGDKSEAKLAEDRRGRHAKSQPRASASSPAPAAVTPSSDPEPTRTSLVRSGYRDSWHDVWRTPLGAVTADDIAPVVLAAPQAAPDLNGAADTGTMPKVELAVGDTGEMRAITDAWISEHIRSEAIA